jgi:hypothetical protein
MPSITERRFQWRSTGSRRYRGEEGLTPQDIAIHHDYLCGDASRRASLPAFNNHHNEVRIHIRPNTNSGE